MPYEIPTDLIQRVQISLRREAGLGSYNPDDPSLPDPPNLEQSIAEFDPSPDEIRCKHCKGKLLRGAESIICVYCGREQQRDYLPGSISFNSTVAFRWLLQSLGLDGSEIVAPTVDDNRTSRGRSVQNEEVSLTDFLNLELEWPGDSERFGVTHEHEAEMPGKRLLNLVGLESGDLFPGITAISGASTEQALPKETRKPVENAILQVPGKATLFENQLSSEASMKLDVLVLGQADSFSGWEADFQSASSDTQHVDNKLSDPSGVHNVDYASHMDSVFGSAKDLTEGRSTDVTVSQASSSNRGVNDPWSNSSSRDTEAKDEVNMILEDSRTVLESENASSASAERFENQQETSSSDVPDNGMIVGEDLYVAGKGMVVSTDAETNQRGVIPTFIPENEKNLVNNGSSDAWGDFAGSRAASDNQAHTSSVEGHDDVLLDSWNGITSSSVSLDNQLPTGSVDAIEGGASNLGHYSVVEWDSFTSLTSAHKNQQKALGEKNHDDSLGLWANHSSFPTELDYFQTIGNKSSANGTPNKGESTFDVWNDLASSSVEQVTQQETNHMEVADNKMSGVHNIADEWVDFMSLNKIHRINGTDIFESRGNGDEDDPFYAWNEFTSSTNVSDEKGTAQDTKIGTWDSISKSDSVQQTVVEQASESKTSIEGNDLFNSWGDFRSSGNTAHDNLASSTAAFDNSKVNNDIFSSSIVPQANIANSLQQHDDLMNEWSNLQDRESIGPKSKMISEGDGLFDWGTLSTRGASDKPLKTGGVAVDQDMSENLDQFDDAWTDFTSSKIVQGDHNHNTSNVYNDAEAVNSRDPLDSWNIFISSSGQTGDWTRSSEEHPSKVGMFNSTSNSLDVSHSGSLQPGLFPGAFNKLNGMAQLEVLPPDAPDWFGMKNENVESEGNAKEIQKSDIRVVSEAKSIEAELLISQIHDLSFMLESSLSVPKR
ncbi:hypothetical protein Dimus_019710 [Dionaea muscipula]